MNPLKKLAGQTAIYGLSSVIGRLLNYLLVPLYTRYFLPSEFGVVTEIYAYVAFLVVILTYGFETAFFRFSKNCLYEICKSKTVQASFDQHVSNIIYLFVYALTKKEFNFVIHVNV